jgi:hypothetical protein
VSTRWIVRWGMPLAVALGGVVVALTVNAGSGEAVVVAAACIAVGNTLLRFGFSSDPDRDREEQARAFFDEHGHWPDERP